MESMGKKPRRHRRAFTPEFKAEIVELCQREGSAGKGGEHVGFDRAQQRLGSSEGQAQLHDRIGSRLLVRHGIPLSWLARNVAGRRRAGRGGCAAGEGLGLVGGAG
jgi:hypothetical protein